MQMRRSIIPTDAMADEFCHIQNWEPLGTTVRFEGGEVISKTFRMQAKEYIVAALLVIPNDAWEQLNKAR